jgi:O-antigen ligase
LLLFGQRLEERLLADEGSAHARVPLMKLALSMAEDHPVLGVGANNFPVRIPEYAGWDLRGQWLYTVHNRYLVVWSETGTPALICYVWFLVAACLQGRRIWRARDRFLSPLALGLSCALLGLMAHMLVEVFRGRAILQLLFVVAALLACMEFIVRTQPESTGSRLRGFSSR